MKIIFEPTKALTGKRTSYCPGCGHGILLRIIGECIEELGVQDKALAVLGVGCSTPSIPYMKYDRMTVQHGRAMAAATGAKRVNGKKIVYTYQGDGDAYSIGMAESMHAAVRGENITAIIVNNTVFAMTGGQMAPTTLDGQVTATSPYGRDFEKTGAPLHFPEMVAAIPAVRLAARTALYDTRHIRETKKIIKKAFENQINGLGYSMVEVLSGCPTNSHMTPEKCNGYVADVIEKEYPLGIFKE